MKGRPEVTDAAATKRTWFNGRHAIAAVVLIYLPMLPTLAFAPLGLTAAVGPFLLGAMAAMLAAILIGGRFALLVAGLVALFNFAAVLVSSLPILAGLVMGVAALLYGITARRGVSSVLVIAPISVAFTVADPATIFTGASTLTNATVVGGVALAGALWGWIIGAVLGRRVSTPSPTGIPLREAVAFAVIVAVVAGVTTGVVVALQLQHGGAWILLTILLLIQPDYHLSWQRTGHRIIGTVIGFGIALAIGLIISQPTINLLLGMLMLTIAVYLKLDSTRPYWQFVAFLTPGIVLAEGAGGDVVNTDVARLWFTLVGAAIAIAVLVVAKLVVKDSGMSAGSSDDVSVAQ